MPFLSFKYQPPRWRRRKGWFFYPKPPLSLSQTVETDSPCEKSSWSFVLTQSLENASWLGVKFTKLQSFQSIKTLIFSKREKMFDFFGRMWNGNDVCSPLNSAPDAKFAAQLRKQDKGSLFPSIGQQPSCFPIYPSDLWFKEYLWWCMGKKRRLATNSFVILRCQLSGFQFPTLPSLSGRTQLATFAPPPLSRGCWCLHWAVGNSNPFSQQKRDRLRISHVQKYGKTTWVTGQAYSDHEWADETIQNCNRALKQKDFLLLLCCFCIAKTASFAL